MGVKKSSRRRLKEWHLDGELNELKAMILGIAGKRRMICWNSEAADLSFSTWERRRQRGEIRMQGGDIAGILQFVPLARHHCHSDAAISEIDSLDKIDKSVQDKLSLFILFLSD
ncbi:MAG: hypothetical protein ACTFAL_16660 [Candidatus Electronema sp. V4]|uniref:hypothetical protein n=1 Tax=Candidatus Electronema sp. V4 TaxID=3454756 RepID=UPI004055736E